MRVSLSFRTILAQPIRKNSSPFIGSYLEPLARIAALNEAIVRCERYGMNYCTAFSRWEMMFARVAGAATRQSECRAHMRARAGRERMSYDALVERDRCMPHHRKATNDIRTSYLFLHSRQAASLAQAFRDQDLGYLEEARYPADRLLDRVGWRRQQ
jgi:hypothetical protein